MDHKQGKKRPASRSEEEEVKNARAKTIDDEVEEFFALIRRIRATSRLVGKDSHRTPSFRREDFAGPGAPAAGKASSSDGGGRRPSEPSSTDESGEVLEGDDKDETKPEGGEDNGLPACLDLSLCLRCDSRGHHQGFLMERTVGSSARGGLISHYHILDRS